MSTTNIDRDDAYAPLPGVSPNTTSSLPPTPLTNSNPPRRSPLNVNPHQYSPQGLPMIPVLLGILFITLVATALTIATTTPHNHDGEDIP